MTKSLANNTAGNAAKKAGNDKAGITLTIEHDEGLEISANELRALIESTNKENPTNEDRAALAAAFDKYPDLALVVGNLARRLRKSRVHTLVRLSHFLQESVIRTMDKIEGELGYDQAPMASKLLIEQVLASWADLATVQSLHDSRLAGSHSSSDGEYWDKRLTRAQARYMRALETLAKVNRLSKVVPPVQVNIATQGGQQINMAGGPENVTKSA